VEKKYSIYVLKDPITFEIRYVGLSYNVNKRYQEHITDKIISYKQRWINTLIKNNKKPLLEIIEKDLSLSKAFELEIYYIKEYKNKGFRLTNSTIGGNAPMANKTHTNETKLKMSKGRLGINNSFYNKKHSDESKFKISNSLKGKPSWNAGKKLSSEHIEKLKIAKIDYTPHNKGKTRFDLILMEELLKKGLKQKEVAKYFNTDQGTISRYIKKHKFNLK
jgi:group I intron endonuclease